jgi:hypothetical protein
VRSLVVGDEAGALSEARMCTTRSKALVDLLLCSLLLPPLHLVLLPLLLLLLLPTCLHSLWCSQFVSKGLAVLLRLRGEC